jgi:hypothetical protein
MMKTTGRKMMTGSLLMAALLLFAHGTSYAKNSFMESFRTTYPAAVGSPIDNCGICHVKVEGGGSTTPYGKAYKNKGNSFAAIQSLDSDGDTFNNIMEIRDWSNPGVAASKPVRPVITDFRIPATWSSLIVPIRAFTATDNVRVTGYKLTTAAVKPAAGSTGWKVTKPASYAFSTPGTKTLYAWVKDSAGLVSLNRHKSVTITLPPVAAQAATASAESLMPLPAGQEVFTYETTATPTGGSNPAVAMPVGVNPDGDAIDIQVNIGELAGPVNVYLTLYVPAEKPFAPVAAYGLQPDNTFRPAVTGDVGTAGVQPWKTGVTKVDEAAMSGLPAAEFPTGQYLVVLTVTDQKNESVYYEWLTHFEVR